MNLIELEKVMLLMIKHKIDEVASSEFTLKKTKHESFEKTYLHEEILKNPHLKPGHDIQPFNEETFLQGFDQKAIDEWAIKGDK